jgi:hypothetical protein
VFLNKSHETTTKIRKLAWKEKVCGTKSRPAFDRKENQLSHFIHTLVLCYLIGMIGFPELGHEAARRIHYFFCVEQILQATGPGKRKDMPSLQRQLCLVVLLWRPYCQCPFTGTITHSTSTTTIMLVASRQQRRQRRLDCDDGGCCGRDCPVQERQGRWIPIACQMKRVPCSAVRWGSTAPSQIQRPCCPTTHGSDLLESFASTCNHTSKCLFRILCTCSAGLVGYDASFTRMRSRVRLSC